MPHSNKGYPLKFCPRPDTVLEKFKFDCLKSACLLLINFSFSLSSLQKKTFHKYRFRQKEKNIYVKKSLPGNYRPGQTPHALLYDGNCRTYDNLMKIT